MVHFGSVAKGQEHACQTNSNLTKNSSAGSVYFMNSSGQSNVDNALWKFLVEKLLVFFNVFWTKLAKEIAYVLLLDIHNFKR